MNQDIIYPWLKCIYHRLRQDFIEDNIGFYLRKNNIEELKAQWKDILNCKEYERLTEYSKHVVITLLENQKCVLSDISQCFTIEYMNKLYNGIIKLIYNLQTMYNKNMIYGYESMHLPSALSFMYDEEICKDRVISTAITAVTRILDFEIDDENKFISDICKGLDNRHIISIYIPFIPHSELSNKIFSRYEVINVKTTMRKELDKINKICGCICDMDTLTLQGCKCNF